MADVQLKKYQNNGPNAFLFSNPYQPQYYYLWWSDKEHKFLRQDYPFSTTAEYWNCVLKP